MADATFDALTHGDCLMESTKMERKKTESLHATLPKQKGWRLPFLCRYKRVWLYPERLPLVLDLEQHLRAAYLDLLLATAIKIGTTWLKSLPLPLPGGINTIPMILTTLCLHRYLICSFLIPNTMASKVSNNLLASLRVLLGLSVTNFTIPTCLIA